MHLEFVSRICIGSITLKPRPLASPGELVVLWIIHDEAVFDCFTALTEGTNYQCHTDLQGYVCKVRTQLVNFLIAPTMGISPRLPCQLGCS